MLVVYLFTCNNYNIGELTSTASKESMATIIIFVGFLSLFHCDSLIVGACTIMSESSVFPHSGKKRYFSCPSLSVTLCDGASIREYKVYACLKALVIVSQSVSQSVSRKFC